METRLSLLSHLDETVSQLLALFGALDPPAEAPTGEWCAKDVLAHLTFWQESFARNVGDLAAGRNPVPLKGTLGELNRRSVEEMQHCTTAELLARFAAAQALIRMHILDPRITSIPYRRGSREYTPEEHLQIVDDHIRQHLKQLQRSGYRQRK